MAITIISKASSSASIVTSFSPTLPGSIVAGDLLLALVWNTAQNSSYPGWNRLLQSVSYPRFDVYWRVATGAGDTLTIGYDSAGSPRARVYCIRGGMPGYTSNGTFVSYSQASSQPGSADPPSVNMLLPSAMTKLVIAMVSDYVATGAPSGFSNLTTTNSLSTAEASVDAATTSINPSAFTGGTTPTKAFTYFLGELLYEFSAAGTYLTSNIGTSVSQPALSHSYGTIAVGSASIGLQTTPPSIGNYYVAEPANVSIASSSSQPSLAHSYEAVPANVGLAFSASLPDLGLSVSNATLASSATGPTLSHSYSVAPANASLASSSLNVGLGALPADSQLSISAGSPSISHQYSTTVQGAIHGFLASQPTIVIVQPALAAGGDLVCVSRPSTCARLPSRGELVPCVVQ